MRVIMNEVMNGENWPLNVWPPANRALEVICVEGEGEGDVVFTIGVLGPGTHSFGAAGGTGASLRILLGEAALPDGRIVEAEGTANFREGEEIGLHCKAPVIFYQLRK